MDVNLYVKEENGLKVLKVPKYVVKDLLRDRLSKSEVARIHRFAEKTEEPKIFKSGSVVVDFNAKLARCFQAGLDIDSLEPTWDVKKERIGFENY